MNLFKVTESHKKYWKNRRIDWATHYGNWDHPHRFFISQILKTFHWLSLIEMGCGAGANLMNIVKNIPSRQVGGVDINTDAIAVAEKAFKNGLFKVNSADDVMMSDKSTDVVLVDAVYIYVDPSKIRKYVREAKRIARNYILLCEFHSTSWWNRLALKVNTGYNAYDWRRLLESEDFYDIALWKIPKEAWSGTPWEQFGYIILAKVPRR